MPRSSKLLQTSKTPNTFLYCAWKTMSLYMFNGFQWWNQELKSSFSGNCHTFSSHFRQLSTKTPHKEGRQRHWESNLCEWSATKMKLLGSLKPETSRIYKKTSSLGMSMQNMCLLVVLSTKLNSLQITFPVTTPFPFTSVSHITYHHWYRFWALRQCIKNSKPTQVPTLVATCFLSENIPPGKDRWRSPLPLVLVYHWPLYKKATFLGVAIAIYPSLWRTSLFQSL